jgi:hypothetical protein
VDKSGLKIIALLDVKRKSVPCLVLHYGWEDFLAEKEDCFLKTRLTAKREIVVPVYLVANQ